MPLDPILVLAVCIVLVIVAARLMWIGLRNGVHDEPSTLNTRGDDDYPPPGSH